MGACLSTGKESHSTGAQPTSYPKNQVVPEDAAQLQGGAGTPAPTHLKAANGVLEKSRSTAAGGASCAWAALTPQQTAAIQKQPVLRELVAACTSGGPASAAADAQKLRSLCSKVVELSLPGCGGVLGADALHGAAAACCGYIECMLGPVVSTMERLVSSQGASSSLPGGAGGAGWDTLDTDDLLGALQQALTATYPSPSELKAVCAAAGAAAKTLETLRAAAAMPTGSRVPLRAFQVPAVNSLVSMLGVVLFRKVVLESQAALEAKAAALAQLLAHLQWQETQLASCLAPHAAAMLMSVQQAAAHGEGRARFTVRRAAAFWDALPQAQEQGLLARVNTRGARPVMVFPAFVDEWAAVGGKHSGHSSGAGVEAGEGHGPRKEFFSLAGADMVGSGAEAATAGTQAVGDTGGRSSQRGTVHNPKLFVYNRSAGCYWFNTGLAENENTTRAYFFSGWLLGQCLLAKAPLGLTFPPLLMHHLLEGPSAFDPDLEVLAAFDPAAAQTVRTAMALPTAQFRGMLELEGLPANTSPAAYGAQAVRMLLVEGVEWQARCMREGLLAATDVPLLCTWGLGPDALAAAVVGGGAGGSDGEPIDVRKVFRVVMDAELCPGGPGDVLGALLWEVVSGWPADRVRAFLAFVTGSARLPVPGSELLRVEAPFVALGAAAYKAQLGMLPQAHTCDNLLELPNYWVAILHTRGHKGSTRGLQPSEVAALRTECKKILDDRLSIAVTSCSGYGLDERDADGGDSDDGDTVRPLPTRSSPHDTRPSGGSSRGSNGSMKAAAGRLEPLGAGVGGGSVRSAPLGAPAPAPRLGAAGSFGHGSFRQGSGHSEEVLQLGVGGGGGAGGAVGEARGRSSGGGVILGAGPKGGLAPPVSVLQPPAAAMDQARRNLVISLAEDKDTTLVKLSQSLDPITPLADLSGFRAGAHQAGAAGGAAPLPGRVVAPLTVSAPPPGASSAAASRYAAADMASPLGGVGSRSQQQQHSGRHEGLAPDSPQESFSLALEVPDRDSHSAVGTSGHVPATMLAQLGASYGDSFTAHVPVARGTVGMGGHGGAQPRGLHQQASAGVDTEDLEALLDQFNSVQGGMED